jgi:pimeloyl-ACP methyl ester carboxylesterase
MSDVKYVDLHGDRVAYREAGSGEVVVLIHGMAGSSETWEAVLPRLATNYRVIAPDLLGHGRSDKPRTDYSLAAFAAGLRDLFREWGIRRATIVGHSLGGGVAMQLMYQHPECCQRLILISSGGLGPDVGWFLRLLTAPGAEFVLPVIAPKIVPRLGNRIGSWLSTAGLHSPRTGQVWRGYCSLSDHPTRAAFLRTLRSVVDYRGQSVSALSRLRLRSEVPTLVVWGERDQIIPVEHGYAVRDARPGSRLDVLTGVGHFPHVEAPHEVLSAIEDFIADSHDATQRLSQTNSQTRIPRGENSAGVDVGCAGRSPTSKPVGTSRSRSGY